MAVRLSLATLGDLPAAVARPSYDRAALTPGIVHIGVGNFHRAHQAVYLDRLFEAGEDHDWAIVGAGVRPADGNVRERLAGQDWLTTVVELDPEGLSARVTGAMIDMLPVDAGLLVRRLCDPAIRIVSLTITEGGYFIDATNGDFQRDHPDIVHDAAHPDAPKTVFGILLAALRLRFDAGQAPFTVMSCDNLPENGDITRRAVLGLASLATPQLAARVASEVAFPNGMVDCITPATGERERRRVAEEFGIEDAAPVMCEPFRQWVLQDRFPHGRPALEKVGVRFVDDVTPYELMKLRILNGGHATIAYPSALLGYRYGHQAMADPDIRGWLMHLGRSEIIPVLPPIAEVDLDNYLGTCARRFSNSAVADTIGRLCFDGSNRQPKFILPTVRDALDKGLPCDGLALEVAFWCRYCAASAETGSGIVLEDERADQLAATALDARTDPILFLNIRDVFGDLSGQPRFADAFAIHLRDLWANGPRAVLQRVLSASQDATD
ncbi:MAG: mannitol dehydrogenase family protein [Inquilinaceae bacterium]